MSLRKLFGLFNHQPFRQTFYILTNQVNSGSTLKASSIISHRELDIRLLSSKAKYPPLSDSDLDEVFIKGGGRGGQAVNKSSNCVQLTHKLTGIVIKCHHGRSLDLNRKKARRRMQEALDKHYNGENSLKERERQASIINKQKKRERARQRLEEKKALKVAAADVPLDSQSEKQTEEEDDRKDK